MHRAEENGSRTARRHAARTVWPSTTPDGRWLRIQACRTPEGGSIGIHIDITELKHREKELNVQNMRFEAALQNMSHGLAMFDRDQRLVICNERFAQVYALPPELVMPGIRLEEILKYRVASGSLRPPIAMTSLQPGWRMCSKASHPTAFLNSAMVGSSPWASANADGGWVSTHEDVTERRRSEDQIAHLARHDTLTGLPNRVLFREYMESALARVRRGEILALHCVDLDQFKGINDALGHVAGDALLMQVAARIRSCVRETDLVTRFGGDEFAVVQIGLQRSEEAGLLATGIVRALSEPYDFDNYSASISASIGIAMAPADGTHTDQLLRKADIAMYRAKADGRRTFRHFSPDMDAALQVRRLLALDLERAMKMQEFELFYQPVINIRSEEVIGFEALLRWRHPERGLVLPSEFIPIAEEKGLILELGEWVLRRACRDAVGWPGELSVAVNLSPLQLRSRKLVRTVVHALAESGLGVRRLELEITESVLLQENTQTPANLTQLKNLGWRLRWTASALAIPALAPCTASPSTNQDRPLLRQRSIRRGHATAIVRALVSLANSLGIVAHAEGVETEDSSSGCVRKDLMRCRVICSARRGRPTRLQRSSCGAGNFWPKRRDKRVVMRRLVFRIEQFEAPAKAKSSDWGYDRIAGALANLGYEISEWVMDGPKTSCAF
jgi:diguanylate cyclase (GGDEF)-like protein